MPRARLVAAPRSGIPANISIAVLSPFYLPPPDPGWQHPNGGGQLAPRACRIATRLAAGAPDHASAAARAKSWPGRPKAMAWLMVMPRLVSSAVGPASVVDPALVVDPGNWSCLNTPQNPDPPRQLRLAPVWVRSRIRCGRHSTLVRIRSTFLALKSRTIT